MLKTRYKIEPQDNFVGQNLPRLALAKQQKTIKNSISFSGIGLHSGKKINMMIKPAPPGTGHIFRQKRDNGVVKEIQASYKSVKSTNMCTLISNSSGDYVSTVEHILSS